MTAERCWYYHYSQGRPPERCTLPDGHEPVTGRGYGAGHVYPSMLDGYPHDYGQHCCCVTCSGPEGDECSPDVLTGHCVRCNRAPSWDDPETTALVLEAIAARVASQADGQTSWLG